MANEFRTLDSHSAEYFGGTRCTAPALHLAASEHRTLTHGGLSRLRN